MGGFDRQAFEALMKEHGDTQAALAGKLGMTRQNLGQILSGKQSFTLEQVRKIAELYEMTPMTVWKVFLFPVG